MHEVKYQYFGNQKRTFDEPDKNGWYYLYASRKTEMEKGKFYYVPLGISIEVPSWAEAIIVPATHLLQMGILHQHSFSIFNDGNHGLADELRFPCYALWDTKVNYNDSIARIRFKEKPKLLRLQEVRE